MASTQKASAELGDAYNPFDQRFLDEPHRVYHALHREAPVCWSDHFEAYLITRYEDVVRAANDPVFSSYGNSGPSPPTEVQEELQTAFPLTKMLYSTDPPEHTRLRTLIQGALSARLVESFEPAMRSAANEVVDTFAGAGRAELYHDYVQPLNDVAILDFVGVPREDHEQVWDWHHTWERLFIPGREPEDLRAQARRVVTYQHYYAKLGEDRRVNPRDDLVTALVNARADGHEPLTTGEIVWGLFEIVGAAGNTVYGMANVLLKLLDDQELWERLVRDRSLLPAAVEEGMRVESPVLGIARETAEPLEIGGTELPQGTPVLLAYGAANHDEDTFEKPERFDPTRKNVGRQVTLGRGPHYCAGAKLARLMITVAADVLLDRLPTARFEDGYEPAFYAPFPFLRSIASLPVRWDVLTA
jgi:cytochrome P450